MKKIELKKSIKGLDPYLLIFVIGLILTISVNIFFILFCIPFILKFFFTAKLKLKPGDVVLFFGLPGSGKTMMLTKVAIDNKNRFEHIISNPECSHIDVVEKEFHKNFLGHIDLGNSLLLYDEASLDGFDNRSFAKNFSDPATLMWHKKIRHFGEAVVYGNQGWSELDCKIRDALCNIIYYTENMGSYSRATRLYKDISINNQTGEIQEGYMMPGLLDRILHPSDVLYVRHKKYGKHYKTINKPSLPDFWQIKK